MFAVSLKDLNSHLHALEGDALLRVDIVFSIMQGVGLATCVECVHHV